MRKSRILFGDVLGLAILFAYAYPTKMAFMLLYAVLALMLFSFLSVVVARFFIRIEENIEKHLVFKGEDIAYTILVSNKSIFTYPLVKFMFYGEAFVEYKKGKTLSLTLPPRQEVSEGYSVNFKYRGVYPMGVHTVIMMDFLGLFKLRYKLKNTLQVTVYPSRDEFITLPLKGELLNKAISNFDLYQDNYADVSDVRKYEPSDDYKKIHWKLTAKKNEFMVKNYQSTALNKTIVFLETNATGLRGMETIVFEDFIVSRVATVVHDCVKNKLPAEVVYGDGYTDKMQINSSEELNRLYYLLAEVQFAGRESMAHTLRKAMSEEDGYFNIVLVLFHFDLELQDILHDLAYFGHNVIIMYCVTEPDAAAKRDLQALTLSGIHVSFQMLNSENGR